MKKTKIGQLLSSWGAEIYLILSLVYYWFMTGNPFNWIAIVLLAVLTSVVWFKLKPLALTIGVIFLLLNLYMVLAMISELNEFKEFNSKALQLLLFGSTYLGLNIFVSVRMLMKWESKRADLTVLS